MMKNKFVAFIPFTLKSSNRVQLHLSNNACNFSQKKFVSYGSIEDLGNTPIRTYGDALGHARYFTSNFELTTQHPL